MTKEDIKVDNIVYYAEMLPEEDLYNAFAVRVKSIYDTYFVCGEDYTNHMRVFKYDSLDKTIFDNYDSAFNAVRVAKLNKETGESQNE